MALTAAALSATQPAPLKIVATKSCQGETAAAHASTPAASDTAPARVTAGRPKRRYSAGRLATVAAPTRKCTVTAVDTIASDHPRAACTACRKIGGP